MIHFNLKKTAFILSAALLSTAVQASGYHFGTQSVNAQGTANAAAAEAADASTIFYNPAGLSKIDSSQISVNANIVFPSIHYEAESANTSERVPMSAARPAAKLPKPPLLRTFMARTKPATM